MTRSMAALLLVAMACAPGFSWPQDHDDGPVGEATVHGTLADGDFGMQTQDAGLRRAVEMRQWIRDDAGYALAWRDSPIDSSGFPPGHANPRELPLTSRDWRANVSVDGLALADDVVDALGTWQLLRPDVSSLPANMAATFQPVGQWLTSASDPRAPRAGDLHVSWQSLQLPPLHDRLILVDDAWALAAVVGTANQSSHVTGPIPNTTTGSQPMPRISLVFAALHALLLLLLVVPIVRMRLGRNIGIGDGGDARMSRLIRVQANFVEYVPIALLLLLMLELGGLSATWLWSFGGTLLLARMLHAFGLSRSAGSSPGRAVGALLTFADIAAMACAGLWLALR